MNERLIIIGARSLGREVCNYAREAGYVVEGFLDDSIDAVNGMAGYPPILGPVERHVVSTAERFVCAVGDSLARARYVGEIIGKGGRFVNVIHPTAYVGPNVHFGDGCIVCPFAMVDCDVKIGSHVLVNAQTYVPHDCRLEDYVTISPGCHMGGRTVVREGVFMGISSSTVPDVEIGEWSYVAAGAVVTKNVASRVMVAGVPAVWKKSI